jgi:hypothetical protein
VRRHTLGDPGPVEELRQYLGRLAEPLYHYFSVLVGELPTLDVSGFEFWIGKEARTIAEVYLHRDTSGAPRRPTDPRPHPRWSSIFHVGPQRGLVGGSTYLCTESPVSKRVARHDQVLLGLAKARSLSHEWIDVPQKANRLVLFDGAMPHFAAPVASYPSPHAPRSTLLANFWPRQPTRAYEGICRVSPKDFQRYLSLPVREINLFFHTYDAPARSRRRASDR